MCAHTSSPHIDILEQAGRFKDRRKRLRVEIPFPAKVQGMTAEGKAFEVYTLLDNLSSSGLYMRLNRRMKPGDSLSAVLTLAPPSVNEEPNGQVAVLGVVQRVEETGDGLFGIAMNFTSYKFL